MTDSYLPISKPSRMECSSPQRGADDSGARMSTGDTGNADAPQSTLTVVLPWPLKELSPNSRAHWRQVAQRKKAYREACSLQAMLAGARQWAEALGNFRKLDVHLTFVPPDRRARDDSNVMASMKAGIDGVADALGIDDRHFRTSYDLVEEIGGFVRLTVRIGEAA